MPIEKNISPRPGLSVPWTFFLFIVCIIGLDASEMRGQYITDNQYKIDILKYDLFIDINSKEKEIKGQILIDGLIINKDLSSLDLNFYDDLKITNLKLNGYSADFRHDQKKMSINIEEIFTDTFSLMITYEGKPAAMGPVGFVFGQVNNNSLVYTLNQPEFASAWFPCNDIPSDKAMFELRIRNTGDNLSVSNGRLIEIIEEGPKKIYHWKTLYPISTYLVALYSAPYEYFTDKVDLGENILNLEYYVMPEHLEKAKKDFAVHKDMMKFFSEKFGEYPFVKEKYGVAEFLWNFGAMEHQTITGIGYNFVSGNNFFRDIYAHELAHQWWGNAVGPQSWNDIWLSEGLATYSEALYNEYKYGREALRSFMLGKFDENLRGLLRSPDDLFGSLVYDKGAWVFHMLRYEAGDSVFFATLQNYFEKYKYSSASTYDFIRIANVTAGQDLSGFFDQWVLNGSDVPEIQYSNQILISDDAYILSIKTEQLQRGYGVYRFKLMFKIIFDDGSETIVEEVINSRTQEIDFSFSKKPIEIVPDPYNWLLVSFRKM